MKPTRAAILVSALAVTALMARDDPSLPAWNATERKQLEEDGWVPAALLQPDPQPSDNQAAPESNPLDAEKPTPEELAADAAPAVEIAENFLPAYFDARPESHLIDPQGLLDPKTARDRLAFLTDHANDSSIDLYVYVFGKDQEIPGEVREEELIERLFASGKPAVIVYYFLGQPERSVLYLSPSLTDQVSAIEQRRALSSSVVQALEKPNTEDQLAAFMVQLAIRIYWMERMIQGEPAPEESAAHRAQVLNAKKLKRQPTLEERIEAVRPLVQPYLPSALWGGGIIVLAGGFGWWWRRRATFRLPELEVEPRLGGNHAAGIGAVISFASPALPPASQRQQVPDYLRRS